jgi:hypothetical protein
MSAAIVTSFDRFYLERTDVHGLTHAQLTHTREPLPPQQLPRPGRHEQRSLETE